MNHRSLLAIAALATCAGAFAIAQPPQPPQPTPPAGATPAAPDATAAADMQAYADAATPGPMQAFLAKSAGAWTGESTMWPAPGAEPIRNPCTSTAVVLMEGRYVKSDYAGDMPGMGPFTGMSIAGYDNVAKKFQSCWIDNTGTGIMTGTGELGPDGTTLTWNFTFNCPITKKPTILRQIERHPSADAMSLEMFGNDPHSGKEFKLMEIHFKRASAAASPTAPVAPAHPQAESR